MRKIFLIVLVVFACLSALVDISSGWSRRRRRRRYVSSRRRRRSCSPQSCSYYWSSYGSCSRSCGGGSKNQQLIIIRYASCGGTPCPYNRYRTISCNTHCCRVDCAWSWNSWSSCQGCGMSRQTRTMSITRNPSCGGTMCPLIRSQTQNCNTGV